MSLIVSLRILDGIVLAGDSMATVMGESRFGVESDVKCPKCGISHKVQGNLPPLSLPAATFSYAQKVLPFCENFGIGISGSSMIGSKSVYFVLRSLEQKIKQGGQYPKNATEVAEVISEELQQFVDDELRSEGRSLDDIASDEFLLSIQLVGYDDTNPKTVGIEIGKTVKFEPIDGLGCTLAGVKDTALAIISDQTNTQFPHPSNYNIKIFSLQDAIDFAEFLIRTTIDCQRFSVMIPNVGGDIDIALVTPFDGFQWIRQKRLGTILEEKQYETT